MLLNYIDLLFFLSEQQSYVQRSNKIVMKKRHCKHTVITIMQIYQIVTANRYRAGLFNSKKVCFTDESEYCLLFEHVVLK